MQRLRPAPWYVIGRLSATTQFLKQSRSGLRRRVLTTAKGLCPVALDVLLSLQTYLPSPARDTYYTASARW